MTTFYVSLVRDFIGCYLKVEAEDEQDVRLHMNRLYPKLWCGVYTQKPSNAKHIIVAPDFIAQQYNRVTGDAFYLKETA